MGDGWSSGDTYLHNGKVGALKMGYDPYASVYGTREVYSLRYEDGTSEQVDRYGLSDSNRVAANHVFRIGDVVEIKSDDPLVDELPRGKIVNIAASEWSDRPYTVRSMFDESTTKFAAYEMNKIMTALSWENRSTSIGVIEARLAIAEAEVQGLKTALEVLRYGAGAR